MENKENKVIPYIFPTDYHMTPFQEGFGYDPYVGYIGIARDTIEKLDLEEDYLY